MKTVAEVFWLIAMPFILLGLIFAIACGFPVMDELVRGMFK